MLFTFLWVMSKSVIKYFYKFSFCYLMAEWVAKLFWTICVSAYIERRPGKQKILKTHHNAFFGMHLNDAVYFCIVQNNFLTWHVINGGSREEVSNKNFRKVKVWDFSLCHLHVLKIQNAFNHVYHHLTHINSDLSNYVRSSTVRSQK